ncbi:PucR family transcriptional regulator [Aeromicrobium sp. P5_D10]
MANPTVAEIVDRIGPTIVVGTSGLLGAEVHDILVTDPAFPLTPRENALVVAPGFEWGSAPCEELLATAAAANVAAVVLKGRSLPPPEQSSVPVLIVEPAVDWSLVVALLRTAATAIGPLPDGEESLFGLADAIASLCGGPVVLLDPAWRLIAYSGGQPHDEVRSQTILARRAPADALEGLRRTGAMEALTRGEIVRLADEEVTGLGQRYAVAARAGTEMLATIWWQPDGEVSDAEVRQGLRQGADLAALTLLRHSAGDRLEGASGAAAFHALLSGARTERLVADRLGVDLERGFVLAGLRPTATEENERAGTLRRLASMVRTHCDAYRVNSQVAAGPDAVYVLFEAPDVEQRRRAVQVVTDMHTRLQKSAPHRAMVSSSYPSLAETAAMKQTVDELLVLSERRGWTALTDSDDVEASWRLEQFREVALAHPSLLSGPIIRLGEHDRTEGTEFVTTLRAYFESVGDMRAVAKQLGLHVNTVRYRINKAQSIAHFSLDSADERLLAELQIRLLS